MVDYTFSSTATQTLSTFNVDSDVLTFASAVGSAAAISVTEISGSTVFTHASGGRTTLTGITMDKLSTSNINFANGSKLLVGDVSTSTLLDSLGQAAATFVLTTGNDQVVGLGGNDTITTSEATGGDLINGNAGDDSITASAAAAGNHTIHGGAGADVVTIAGAGANRVYGDNGNDQVSISGNGANWINGNAGDDTLQWTGSGANTVYGGQGTDTITVGAAATGASSVFGDAGTDTITINATASGNNTVAGGTGVDTITVAGNGANVINGNAGADVISVTGTGANTVRGGQDNDAITISGAATGLNLLYGDAGDDTLVGTYAGTIMNTTVYGGAGNDIFRFNVTNAVAHRVIIGDFATGTDVIQATMSGGATAASLTFSGNGSSPTIANAANESISLSGFTGSLTSTNFVLSDSTVLATNGSSTAATLTGGAGADQLVANNGGDVLNGAAGADKMTGGSGNDIFVVTLVAEHAAGETVTGGAGTDILRVSGTTAGTTTITATTDVEKIEVATGTSATGVFSGTTAHDVTAAAQVLFGSQTGVWLQGNDGANVLTASSTGADTLIGGGGVDTLALGGAGNGADVIGYIGSADIAGNNTITNFNMSADQIGFGTTLSGLSAGTLSTSLYGETAVITAGVTDNTVITTNVNLLVNVATLKVLVLVDADAGAQAMTSAEIDTGLKNSNTTGVGWILTLNDDASATAATLYYDPNMDNDGDIVLVGTYTTAGANLTLANADASDFVVFTA